jgi:hypothetical protein
VPQLDPTLKALGYSQLSLRDKTPVRMKLEQEDLRRNKLYRN